MARIRHNQFSRGCIQFFETISRDIGFSDLYLQDRKIKCDDSTFKFDMAIYSGVSFKSVYRLLAGDTLCIANFSGKDYFIVVTDKEVKMPYGMTPIDTATGLFVAVILELEIKVKNTKTIEDIKEFLLYPIDDPANHNGLEMADLEDFFPEINVFEINHYISNYEIELYKYSILYCCSNDDLIRLSLKEEVLDAFSDLAQQGYNNLPYSNLLRAIVSTEWRYCFIDLYRCVEFLYILGRTYEAGCALNAKLDNTEIYTFLSKCTKDYYKEDQCLKFLFSLMSQESKDLLSNAGAVKTYSAFYKLRNAIAHGGRKEGKSLVITKESEWRNLVLFTLSFIKDLYTLFDSLIDTFDEDI